MKFLVVDDNPIDLLIAKAVVQRFNPEFDVKTCGSAEEALQYLKQNTESLPDIILLDLNMPVKSGWDFLKEFRNSNIDHIKIYILTSSVNDAERAVACQNPMLTGFLSKPLKMELIEEICSDIKQNFISN